MIIQHLLPGKEELSLINEKKINYKHEKNTHSFKNLTVRKPWGEEFLLFENNYVAVWLLKITPKNSTSYHAHPNKITSLIVLNGSAQCKTFISSYELLELNAIILGKKVFHQTSNQNDDTLYLIEIESPVNKLDLVRYEDNYGRKNKEYESKDNFTARPNSYMLKGSTSFGHSQVTIDFASDFDEFLKKVSIKNNAIITILDRHVWSNNGVKLIEVGNSFNLDKLEELKNLESGFHINDKFNYIVIHKK